MQVSGDIYKEYRSDPKDTLVDCPGCNVGAAALVPSCLQLPLWQCCTMSAPQEAIVCHAHDQHAEEYRNAIVGKSCRSGDRSSALGHCMHVR